MTPHTLTQSTEKEGCGQALGVGVGLVLAVLR